jgi:hypothetical protein
MTQQKPPEIYKEFAAKYQDWTVYTAAPYWDSYLSDVEGNIVHDQDTWKQYNRNPELTYIDILMDFGRFPDDLPGLQYADFAAWLALKYSGKI